jgi:hypothetical protein
MLDAVSQHKVRCEPRLNVLCRNRVLDYAVCCHLDGMPCIHTLFHC